MSLEIIALSAMVLISGLYVVVYLMYHKLSLAFRRLATQINRQTDNTISQIEALLALYVEIKPDHGFPPSRDWVASPDFLRILTQFITAEHPSTIVECSSGLSTLILGASLKKQGHGHVYSLEHDPLFAEKTRRMILLHNLEEWATVIDAPLKNITLPDWEGKWYDVADLPSGIVIDMLVIDGPPHFTAPLARYPAIPVLENRIKSGTIVLLDDANRPDEQQAVTMWLKLMNFEKIPYLSAEKGIAALRKQENIT